MLSTTLGSPINRVDLSRDLHMHSTFSDGRHSVTEMYQAALEGGLAGICFADHVRRDTDWLPSYVSALRPLDARGEMDVRCGIEAKMLDESGRLDVPDDLSGIDVLVVADHRLPLDERCLDPAETLSLLEQGILSRDRILEALVGATVRASDQPFDVIVAHLFSFLPKVGLSEADVPESLLGELGRGLARKGAVVELSERWRCPGARTVEILARQGVEIVASTDSHRAETVGVYDWVATVLDDLKQRSRPALTCPTTSERASTTI